MLLSWLWSAVIWPRYWRKVRSTNTMELQQKTRLTFYIRRLNRGLTNFEARHLARWNILGYFLAKPLFSTSILETFTKLWRLWETSISFLEVTLNPSTSSSKSQQLKKHIHSTAATTTTCSFWIFTRWTPNASLGWTGMRRHFSTYPRGNYSPNLFCASLEL